MLNVSITFLGHHDPAKILNHVLVTESLNLFLSAIVLVENVCSYVCVDLCLTLHKPGDWGEQSDGEPGSANDLVGALENHHGGTGAEKEQDSSMVEVLWSTIGHLIVMSHVPSQPVVSHHIAGSCQGVLSVNLGQVSIKQK